MSIAEREAENAGPECAFQRLRLDMDDVRDAYIASRTAEPCKEQIEAVAKILACSYLTCAQRNNLMQIAKRLLDAARKAVM